VLLLCLLPKWLSATKMSDVSFPSKYSWQSRWPATLHASPVSDARIAHVAAAAAAAADVTSATLCCLLAVAAAAPAAICAVAAGDAHQYEQHHKCKNHFEYLRHEIHTEGVERELALVILGQMHQHWLQACRTQHQVMHLSRA
jgi:hypothetical protein